MSVFEKDIDAALNHEVAMQRIRESDNSRTHTANAQRMVDQFGDHLRYAEGIGSLVWTETHWEPAVMGEAFCAAQAAAKSIHREVMNGHELLARLDPGSDDYKSVGEMTKRVWRWARDSAQTNHIEQTLKAAFNHPAFRISPTELDAKPNLFNFRNGTLDLDTLEFREHRREDLLTGVAGGNLDLDARAPNFEANVARFIRDPAVLAFMQRAVAAAMYGYRSREIQYLFGPRGLNFKSTFLRCIREAFGGYAYHTDPDILIRQQGRKSVSDKSMLAELRGKRLVTTSEIEKGQTLAGGMVKLLTEEVIRAEPKYRTGFNFYNQTSFWFSANYKLRADGTDTALYDRLRLSEWDVRLEDGEKDELYFEKYLRQEIDGILTWCYRGLQDYHARGNETDPPKQVMLWTAQYQAENDIVGSWLKAECELTPEGETSSNELWASFLAYSKNENGARVSRTQWKNQLADLGLTDHRERRGESQIRVYNGVRLLEPAI